MNDSKEDKINLDWVRNIPMKRMRQLQRAQLLILQFQAEKDIFSAQLTKDWIDSAIRFQALDDEEKGE